MAKDEDKIILDWTSFLPHQPQNIRRYEPWYNMGADYNTNAKSYYDFLARFPALFNAIQNMEQRLLNRDVLVADTASVDLTKTGDWLGNCDSGCLVYDNEIKLKADVKLSKITKDYIMDSGLNILQQVYNCPNAITIESDGLFAPDYEKLILDMADEINKNHNNITNLQKSLGDLTNVVNKQGAFINKLISNLADKGVWSGGQDGDFAEGMGIAGGNINLFGGTVDGSSWIRTNNGRTENDITAGIS